MSASTQGRATRSARAVLILFAAFATASSFAAPVTNLIFDLRSLTTSPMTGVVVRVEPLERQVVNGAGVQLKPFVFTNDYLGFYTQSLVYPGTYRTIIEHPEIDTPWTNCIPETNGTGLYWFDFVCDAGISNRFTSAYTKNQSDGRFALKWSLFSNGVAISTSPTQLNLVGFDLITNSNNKISVGAPSGNGSGDVTTAQLLNQSNVLRSIALPTNTVYLTVASNIQAAWNDNASDTVFVMAKGDYLITSTITNPVGSQNAWFKGGPGVRWYWSGTTNGGEANALLSLDSCYRPRFDAITFITPHTNAVRKLVNIDQVKGGGTMTQWLFDHCTFESDNTDIAREQWLVMVSTNSQDNCEFGEWQNCYVQGQGYITNRTIGLFIGDNANALRMKWTGGGFKYCTNAAFIKNGSIAMTDLLNTGNGVEIYIYGMAESCEFRRWRVEDNRQFLVVSADNGGTSFPLVVEDCTDADRNPFWETNKAQIELNGPAPLRMAGNFIGGGSAASFPTFSWSGNGVSSTLEAYGRNLWTTNNEHAAVNGFGNVNYFDAANNAMVSKAGFYRSASSFLFPSNVISMTDTSLMTVVVGVAESTVFARNYSASNNITGSNANFIALSAVGGGNVKDANGNLYVTNSTGIDGGAGGGEANVNGEASVTNATKVGLVYGKSGVTNLLRSIQAGNGIVITNQGTNIPVAIDPAVVASQENATALSNALISWGQSVSNLSVANDTTTSNGVVSLISTNAITNAAVTVTSGAIPKLTDRVTATASGLNVDTSTNLTGAQTIVANDRIIAPQLISSNASAGSANSFVQWASTNGNGKSFSLEGTLIYSNLTLLAPTNGFAGISDPLMRVINVTGTGGNHTGQLAWVSASAFQQSSITLSNIGSAPVTNENSSALQINSGILTVSPGALSNLNSSSIDFPGGANVISNLSGIKYAAVLPSITQSNFIITPDTNRMSVYGATNAVFTNLIEQATGVHGDVAVYLQAVGANMTLQWPAYGALHGYFVRTNANNPFPATTSIAAGAAGLASFSFFGSNVLISFLALP